MVHRPNLTQMNLVNLRSVPGLIALAILLIILVVWLKPRPGAEPRPAPSTAISATETPESSEPFLGEVLMDNYADPSGTVQDDLRYVQRLLMSVRTLVKTQDPGRMAVNEDVVDVLTGRNDYKIVFLPPNHPSINPAKQLIDRWGTPLFFHLEAADRLDVRSAGPDKILFTNDDCHLHADGLFMENNRLTGPPHAASSSTFLQGQKN